MPRLDPPATHVRQFPLLEKGFQEAFDGWKSDLEGEGTFEVVHLEPLALDGSTYAMVLFARVVSRKSLAVSPAPDSGTV